MTAAEIQALELEISEAIEPKPNDWTEHGFLSRMDAWICHNPHSNVRKGEYEWRPRPWTTDETANAILLEMMPFPTLSHYNGKADGDPTPFWACWALNEPLSESASRKLAVCLAFKAWKQGQ